MENKKYPPHRLNKDLPDAKAGTIFEYTEDGYYTALIAGEDGICGKWPPHYVHSNSAWFSPVDELPERIEVVVDAFGVGDEYAIISANGGIKKEKYPIIKKTIEYVLNGDDKTYTEYLLSGKDKLFTQEQFDHAIIKSFWAARHRNILSGEFTHLTPYDYLSSLSPKSVQSGDEKDWEVVEFRNCYGVPIVKREDGLYIMPKFPNGTADTFDEILGGGNTIHSVRRKSDNTVWMLDQKFSNNTARQYSEHIISRFELVDGDMRVWLKDNPEGYYNLDEIDPLPSQPSSPSPAKEFDGCNVCGSELVLIRGKYPGLDKRKTCPTCTTERLEQIHEMSDKDYGRTSQSKQSIT